MPQHDWICPSRTCFALTELCLPQPDCLCPNRTVFDSIRLYTQIGLFGERKLYFPQFNFIGPNMHLYAQIQLYLPKYDCISQNMTFFSQMKLYLPQQNLYMPQIRLQLSFLFPFPEFGTNLLCTWLIIWPSLSKGLLNKKDFSGQKCI